MSAPLLSGLLPDAVVTAAAEYSDGTRTPVEPRDAATVLLLRDASAGTSAYLLRRQRSMDFAGGMVVFPGGGVDRRDFDPTPAWAGPTPAQWSERLGCDEETARALVCAAVRETFEESGVLLAGESADEVVADTTGEDWEADRVALETRELALTDLLERRGLVLRSDLLGAWAGWLTPVIEPKRFRTWFFVARLPEGQRTRDVSTESDAVSWLPVPDALGLADAGEVAMMPPTYLNLVDVDRHADVGAVLADAAGRRVEMFTPQVEPVEGGHALSMPEQLRPLLAERVARRAAAGDA